MDTIVFGHKAPDTDSTASPLIWAWYLSEIRNQPARAVLLGEPNTEAAFVLKRWGFDRPEIIADVEDGQRAVIVDTNNPAELPDNVNNADVCRRSSTTTFLPAACPRGARSRSPSAPSPAPPPSCMS